jgi:hypothetical protein
MEAFYQARFFAKNYTQLQGLRAVPSGLCLLIITLWANLQQGPTRNLTLPILAALGCLLLYILINQYYNRVYGRVKRTMSRAEMSFQATCTILALAAFVVDTSNTINISFLGLVFAVVFAFIGFWYWRPVKALFATNLLLAISFALLSLLPLVGIQEWWTVLGLKHSLLAFTLMFGIFGVIGGVIAHYYFIRSLPPGQEAS